MKTYLFKEMFEMEETYWWHKAKRDYIHGLLKKYLGQGKDKEVLDIGCGTGYFLKEIAKKYNAWGIDKSRECLRFTRKRGLKKLQLVDIEKTPFPNNEFDAATSLDVIEHIKDDLGAMKNINKSLKSEGLLIVAVPALKGLWTYWDEIAGHYRRYSKEELVDLFEKSGFRVEFVRFTNILPFFAASLLRTIRTRLKKVEGKQTTDFVKMPASINSIIYWLMKLEAFATYYLPAPFGLSLVVVGRKINKTDKRQAMSTTISLYSATGWKSVFSKIRFWDAPFKEVERLVPKRGRIIDLGCGEGLFPNFLGLSSPERKILGVEIDKRRLTVADRGVKNVSFKWGDATRFKFTEGDSIILFHLLHHLSSYKEQEKVLKLCYSGLKKGGKLIVVEVDIKFSYKYLLAWATDHFLVPLLFEKRFYSPIYFRKKEEWIRLLKSYGFKVSWKPAEKGKPFSHIVFVCTKK